MLALLAALTIGSITPAPHLTDMRIASGAYCLRTVYDTRDGAQISLHRVSDPLTINLAFISWDNDVALRTASRIIGRTLVPTKVPYPGIFDRDFAAHPISVVVQMSGVRVLSGAVWSSVGQIWLGADSRCYNLKTYLND